MKNMKSLVFILASGEYQRLRKGKVKRKLFGSIWKMVKY